MGFYDFPVKNAPLYSALCELSHRGGLRFHLPGHKGKGPGRWIYGDDSPPFPSAFDEIFKIDYTEIPSTGNLYEGDGPISRAEELAARYFGMERCYFLTCGASQGVKAALAAFCGHGAPAVLDRN